MKSMDSDSHQAIRNLLAELIELPVSDSIKRSLEGPLDGLSFKVDALFSQQEEGNKIAKKLRDTLQDEISDFEERLNRGELVSLLHGIFSGQQEVSRKLNDFNSLTISKIDELNEDARLVSQRYESRILILSKLSFLNLIMLLALFCFMVASLFGVI